MKAIVKYLARYAEPESLAAERLPGEFGHALEIPAYGEEASLFETLASVPRGPDGDVLIVAVLNARADSPGEIHRANQAARERLARTAAASQPLSSEPPMTLLTLPHAKLLVIDRARPQSYLPAGQGVGLARKIGCDLILRLRAGGRIASPWIHCTDADALLPNDYFEQLRGRDEPETAAALYFFEHRFGAQENLARAARLYEISLRYYVLGLVWAGSPYAYQSMGSCLAIRDTAYAQVRGFPRRNALEDFYVLNKLAKVGEIARLSGAPLKLEGRLSERVPVSTGKALTDLVSSGKRRRPFLLYHPAVFAHLAAWLRVLAAIARWGGDMTKALGKLPSGSPFFRAGLLEDALRRLGAFAAIRDAAGKSKNPETLLRHMNTWFDGFRTLKLIHALRDGGLPSLPYSEALAEAPFTGLSSSTEEDLEELRKLLAEEERKASQAPAGVAALELDPA